MSEVAYVVSGFIIGALTAYSGVGAGALMTPLLVLSGVPSSTAIGSDLLFALVTKAVAVLARARTSTIDWVLLKALAPGGVLGAIVGLALTAVVHVRLAHTAADHALRLLLGIALVAAAAAIAIRPFLRREASAQVAYPFKRLAVLGFGVGLMVSLTSIGAGSLLLPLLLLAVPAVPLSRMVGTDIAFALVLLAPSLLGHAALGDVDPVLSGFLLLGAIPGVLVGTKIQIRLPDALFRFGIAAILTTVGVSMVV